MDSDITFSIAEVADEAGVDVELVSRLLRLGLLEEGGGDGFAPADVGRIRVINALVSEGTPIDELSRAVKEGLVSFSWFDGILPPPPALRDETYEEMFGRLSISSALATRLFEVWGVAMPAPNMRVREDDARLFGYVSQMLSFLGGGEEVLVAAVRYFGDNARRNAESQIAFFRTRVVEPLLAGGLSLKDLFDLINPLTSRVIRPGVQELLWWLHRRHVDALNLQMLIQMVESAFEEAGVKSHRTTDPPAIVFVDLSSFTSRTEETGDEAAADVATRFSDLVRAGASRHRGSVVKFLGDGVMMHFAKPPDAIRFAVELIDETERKGLPPARAGVDAGGLVFRDGDYFGRTVNIAARITDYAGPGQVLVSASVATQLVEQPSVSLDDLGEVSLRGVGQPVRLFSAIPRI